ncbi:MAG TPA: rhomboid family intramembrane serine protease [Vicinamibacterales bacterium]|nr:rhomboid family intramembrane serine protease [Vicinamibacterales bacterium]
MFKRQRTGSVVCASCGSLVGVNDEQCYSCGRRNPGLWGYAPLLRRLGNDFGFVSLIVYGCGAMYVIALLVTLSLGGNILGSGSPLGILAPDERIQMMLGASGAYPVFVLNMWWTILSAGWLHASILHIVMNMMWVRNLGPSTADLYGGPRMVIIYTAGSAGGFLLSSLLGLYPIPKFGAPLTVGASAPIFGLLGALMYYGRRSGSSLVHAEAKGYAVAFFVFGLIFPGVDNAAHAGGFIGGYLAGMLMDPLKPERVNHMIGALVCLVATLLAIAASIFTLLPAVFPMRSS